MIVFYVLVGIVLVAGGVVGFMFYLFNQEANKPDEQRIEPSAVLQQPAVPTGPTLQEMEYKKRVEDLESELKEISERGTSQASEANLLIERLTKENEDLKLKSLLPSSDSNEELAEAKRQTEQLQQDNFLLSNQLQQASAKVDELQQEALLIRQNLDEELKMAHLTIEALKSDKETIILNRESSAQSVHSLNREIDEAQIKIESLQNELAVLRETNDTLRAASENMFNQTQIFQQEIIRQRAQISSLERISDNYRIQLEDKVNS